MAESSQDTTKRKRGPGRQFQKGQSGNPGGRKPDTDEVRQAKEELRKLTLPAVLRLKAALGDPDTKPAEIIKITEIILDRVMGKAAQPIVADVYQAEKPLTIDECFAIAEEVLRDSEAGGTTAP